MTEHRNTNGTFALGNPGGPGRPARPTEAAYMRGLSDALTLDDWREIVGKAVEAAKQGDKDARAWLSRYALGDKPVSLDKLAEREARGISDDDIIEARAEMSRLDNLQLSMAHDHCEVTVERHVEIMRARDARIAERAANELAERERRAARKSASSVIPTTGAMPT